MQNHCINKLLNIEGIIIKKVVPNAHITNGPTEGFNNKIKVLKRTSYGIRNFEHLRTRILLATRYIVMR